jgi:GAF domain-containing protein/HAMP domain-containing protein
MANSSSKTAIRSHPPMQTAHPLPMRESAQSTDQSLKRYLTFFALAMPAFGAIMIAGYALLFVAGLASGTSLPRSALLLTAAGTLVAVLLALPTRRMVAEGDTWRAITRYAVGFGVFFLLLNVAWQGMLIITIVGCWLPIAMLYPFLRTRRQALVLALIAAMFTGFILVEGMVRPIAQARPGDPGALPAILLTLFVVAAFVGIAVITNVLRFRTVGGRLTATFVTVTLLPALVTMIILSIQSYRHDQQLVFEVMNSVSAEKVNQLEQTAALIRNDLGNVLANAQAQDIMGRLLAAEPGSARRAVAYHEAGSFFPKYLATGKLYQEILVLDPSGEVIYSTNPAHRFASFNEQLFFHQALLGALSTTVANTPQFGNKAFVVAEPILTSEKTLGEIIFVSDFSYFAHIVSTPSGAREEGETYLVSEQFLPLTSTSQPTFAVRSDAALSALKSQQDGQGVYRNYAGEAVLGSYRWVPSLHAALITELTQTQAFLPTVFLIGNIVIIGLFAIAISIVAVIFTSRTITGPIVELAGAAESIAQGNLSTRADAGRYDELGTLAKAFNEMAATLQDIVNNLESRVDDRTKDLQRQAMRLRAAAEVSRDSALARDLDELLTRSTTLISQRFGYYHAAIYLLDANREFLVLKAASGEPGRLMVETGYKLSGGETLVASVGRTATSRTSSDLTLEPSASRQPMLPGSRSELALPLKAQGVLLGVLDIQSDRANAFTDEDTAAFELMADQLSTAIERARIQQESERTVRELEHSYQSRARQAWQALFDQQGGILGYSYEGTGYTRVDDVPAVAQEALQRGEVVSLHEGESSQKGSLIALPIKLRGETIGAIQLRSAECAIPMETSALASEITERLAQALETSRLIDESRARAERERSIAEISAKVGSSSDVEGILRTAVQQLSSLAGDLPLSIRLTRRQPTRQAGQE